MSARLVRVLYALDCFLFVLCTLGAAHIGESFSSAAWRSELTGGWYGRIARPLIDWLASLLGDPNHCQRVYLTAYQDLPDDMQTNQITTLGNKRQ
jgi:hypothetical protein